jgi:hypothetical protein
MTPTPKVAHWLPVLQGVNSQTIQGGDGGRRGVTPGDTNLHKYFQKNQLSDEIPKKGLAPLD